MMPSLDPSSRPRVRNAKTPAERMRLFRSGENSAGRW
jgi:hypothetical protein